MSISGFRRYIVSAGLAAAILAGCDGNRTAGTLPQEPAVSATPLSGPRGGPTPCGWLSAAAKSGRDLIYVANGDKILIFSERGRDQSVIGCISTPEGSSTHGLFVDRHGSLYVACGNGTVPVYPRGSVTPSITYSGLPGPMYPIVDHHGDVFVSNGNGAVVEFLPGRTLPYRTLSPAGYEADGMDFDRRGNLYVTYRTAYLSGGIEEFAPGSTKGRLLGMQIVQPQGIIVTDDGTIVVVETGRADGIYVFSKGSQTPYQKLTIAETPVQLAITKVEHKLFLSAFGWLGSGHVYASLYPFEASGKNLASHFHVRIAFHLRQDGHRRRHLYQIQGMALSNGQSF
jgi:DNA-binding beta-propeller fold protein YncE